MRLGFALRARSAFEGMGAFSVIWAGQVATLLGTEIVKFAFILRIWTAGGQATQVIGLALSLAVPRMLLSPVAGVLADRWTKKAVLLASDTGGLAAMLALAAVYFAGPVQVWHIYLALAVSGAAEAFQYPAFASSIPRLVPAGQRQRANGMLTTARSLAGIAGPAAAGVLVALVNLGAILLLDVASFAVALVTIWAVRVPGSDREVRPDPNGDDEPGLWAEAVGGLRHIRSWPSLRGLTSVFFAANLAAVFGFALLPTMVLARSGDNAAAWAAVGVASGVGGVVGGVLLTVVRVPPRHRMAILLLSMAGSALLGQVLMAAGRSVPVWSVAGLGSALLIPMVNDMLTLLLQSKVPEDLQGRVFGAIGFLSDVAMPIALIAAAPLADHVFEPEAHADAGLPRVLAPVVGYGRGTGMASMMLLAGLGTVLVAAVAFASRSVRRIDDLLPDVGSAADQVPDGSRSGGSPEAGPGPVLDR